LIGWHLSTLVPPNQMEVHMHWQFEIYTVAWGFNDYQRSRQMSWLQCHPLRDTLAKRLVYFREISRILMPRFSSLVSGTKIISLTLTSDTVKREWTNPLHMTIFNFCRYLNTYFPIRPWLPRIKVQIPSTSERQIRESNWHRPTTVLFCV
jgi:hypothetical protein